MWRGSTDAALVSQGRDKAQDARCRWFSEADIRDGARLLIFKDCLKRQLSMAYKSSFLSHLLLETLSSMVKLPSLISSSLLMIFLIICFILG